MELDAKTAYEVAMQRLLQKEKELVELTALYYQTLQELQQLKEQLEEGK